jgi:3-dehydroquinate synthase
MTDVSVALGERSYSVHIEPGCAQRLGAQLREQFGARRFALVTNSTLDGLYGSLLEQWAGELDGVKHVLADGEQYKTLKSWQGILDTMLEARLDRKCVVIAFGGGVVGDMAGFAAACFLRGVDFVQVPTTLLAMVDSSVGGKTGVNHAMGKNLIGAFHQPRLVWIDTDLLTTLPRREFVAGYAEVFKTAFIGGREMFDFVVQNHQALLTPDAETLAEGIVRAIKVKAAVVAQDERESGARALLNFGHTFGHALERFFGYGGLLHGEAVYWGMLCATEMAMRLGLIPADCVADYSRLMATMPLPPLPKAPDTNALHEAMFSDKKTIGGTLRFVLPQHCGSSKVVDTVSAPVVLETLEAVFHQ